MGSKTVTVLLSLFIGLGTAQASDVILEVTEKEAMALDDIYSHFGFEAPILPLPNTVQGGWGIRLNDKLEVEGFARADILKLLGDALIENSDTDHPFSLGTGLRGRYYVMNNLDGDLLGLMSFDRVFVEAEGTKYFLNQNKAGVLKSSKALGIGVSDSTDRTTLTLQFRDANVKPGEKDGTEFMDEGIFFRIDRKFGKK